MFYFLIYVICNISVIYVHYAQVSLTVELDKPYVPDLVLLIRVLMLENLPLVSIVARSILVALSTFYQL